MSRMIIWEGDYLFSCFLLGMILMLAYDILRIIRIVLPHRSFFTGLEDMIYWLAVSGAVFVTLYRGNDGIIRWYAVAAIILAMLLFNLCISRFLVPVIGRLLRVPVDFLGKVLQSIYKKVKIVCRSIKKRKKRHRWFHGRKKMEEEKEQ